MDTSSITHNLLLNSPNIYYAKLCECIRSNIDIKNEINSISYETWYSNHVQSLYYLVGDLIYEEEEVEEVDFYGKCKSISEDLGIEILYSLLRLGADIHFKNYYEESLLDMAYNSSTSLLTYRINNSNFKKIVKKLRRASSH